MNTTFDVTLRKIDSELNMRRQYRVSVERDLFGTWSVTCRWGRIGTAGQTQQHPCRLRAEAETLALEIVQKRVRHGYTIAPATSAPEALAITSSTKMKAPATGRGRARRTGARVRRPESGQLSLLEWRPPPEVQLARLSQSQNKTAGDGRPAAMPEASLLMRQLGKPATAGERDRAMSLLTCAAGLRGIVLRRGGALSPL